MPIMLIEWLGLGRIGFMEGDDEMKVIEIKSSVGDVFTIESRNGIYKLDGGTLREPMFARRRWITRIPVSVEQLWQQVESDLWIPLDDDDKKRRQVAYLLKAVFELGV